MLKITSQQMTQLSASCVRSFEDRMASHLGELFPLRCAALGASGVGDVVRNGIHRAAEHGITAQKDVCLFIDLMCTFGERFDSDPRLPWAARILDKGNRQKPAAKVQALCKQAAECLSQEEEPSLDDTVFVSEAPPDFAEALPRAAQEQFSDRTPVGQPVIPCKRHKAPVYRFSL